MDSDQTLIIAEAGVNHNGDLTMAKQLIDVAVEAGADFVKFQTFSAERLVTSYAEKAKYQSQDNDILESQFEMLKRLEMSEEMHKVLNEYCQQKGIKFFSTGFDNESIDFLIDLGVETIKIPSGEITNFPYLQHIGGLGKSVIMSTGMANMGEIEGALDVLEKAGTPRKSITILHCNTEYPTPMKDVNLLAMNSIRNAFGVNVGYSDHTPGIEVAISAVALGAKVIEKHFTLNRNLPGPDHLASLEPDELKAMITAIRNVELALGDGIKRPSESEIKNISVARRSLVAARTIQEGEIFTSENVIPKRPGTGISPMRWDEVIGRVATRDYDIDELILL